MKITNVISFLPVSERKKCTLNCRGVNKNNEIRLLIFTFTNYKRKEKKKI